MGRKWANTYARMRNEAFNLALLCRECVRKDCVRELRLPVTLISSHETSGVAALAHVITEETSDDTALTSHDPNCDGHLAGSARVVHDPRFTSLVGLLLEQAPNLSSEEEMRQVVGLQRGEGGA